MGGLFGSKARKEEEKPEPEPPAPMPDPEDPLAKRRRSRSANIRPSGTISSTADRLVKSPGTIGREFSRSTLGAN